MEATAVLGIVAATWGIVMSLAPILQIRAIRSQGDSDSVSAGQWVVWCVGFSLWLAYGISISDPPLIVNNAFALIMGITTLTIVLRYKTAAKPTEATRPSQPT